MGRSSDNMTPLHYAALNPNGEIIKSLLDVGGD